VIRDVPFGNGRIYADFIISKAPVFHADGAISIQRRRQRERKTVVLPAVFGVFRWVEFDLHLCYCTYENTARQETFDFSAN
jgi:hypothetical protein